MDHDGAAGKALARVVIDAAFHLKGHAGGQEGPEALPGLAVEVEVQAVLGQTGGPVAQDDAAGKACAHGTVHIADGPLDAQMVALSRQYGFGGLIDVLFQGRGFTDTGEAPGMVFAGRVRRPEQAREVEGGRPARDVRTLCQQIGMADGFVQGAEAQGGQFAAHVPGQQAQETFHMFGAALEAGTQLFVLGGDARRAAALHAVAAHDAAHADHQRRPEGEFLGAQQGSHEHVTPGAQQTVGLEGHPPAHAAGHQRLMRLGQTGFPRQAHIVDGGMRAGTGAAVMAGDDHAVRTGLGHTHRDGPDTAFGHQLDGDAGRRIEVTEVVDELRQILDGVDVVMRRRGDQGDPGHGGTDTGDVHRDLVGGQLAAFTGLGTLGRLDLDLFRMGKIFRRDAKAARSDLADAGACVMAASVRVRPGRVAGRILAAFTAVGGHAAGIAAFGQGAVGFVTDGAIGDGRTDEVPQDGLFRLNLVQRDRGAGRVGRDLQQGAQREALCFLPVAKAGEGLPGRGRSLSVRVFIDGRMQGAHGTGAPETRRRGGSGGIGIVPGLRVTQGGIAGQGLQTDAADGAGRAREITVDDIL